MNFLFSMIDAPMKELSDWLHSGRISYLQFIMNGPYNNNFLTWCKEHCVEPDDDIAEFYYDMLDLEQEPVEEESFA